MSNSVGYSALAQQYKERYGGTLAEGDTTIRNVLDVIIDNLVAEGDRVRCVDRFTLEVVHRKERTGRHPVTKEPVKVPAYYGYKVNLSKKLHERLNS
jgi:nucleoid DNA-binding protein